MVISGVAQIIQIADLHIKIRIIDKLKPELQSPRDAIVRITLCSFSEEAKQAWRDAHWEEDLQRAYEGGRRMAEQ